MNKKADMSNLSFICMMTLVIAWFMVIISLYQITDTDSFEINNTKIVEAANLVSLEKGLEMQGSFVLGFGTVDTDIVYYAYEELETDTYVLRSFKTSSWKVIKLIESDDHRPQYVYKRIIGCRKILWVKQFCTSMEHQYELIVPRGTIRRQFNG